MKSSRQERLAQNIKTIAGWLERTYAVRWRVSASGFHHYFVPDVPEAYPSKLVVHEPDLELPPENEVLEALERDVRAIWPEGPADRDIKSYMHRFMLSRDLHSTDGQYFWSTTEPRREALQFVRVERESR